MDGVDGKVVGSIRHAFGGLLQIAIETALYGKKNKCGCKFFILVRITR